MNKQNDSEKPKEKANENVEQASTTDPGQVPPTPRGDDEEDEETGN